MRRKIPPAPITEISRFPALVSVCSAFRLVTVNYSFPTEDQYLLFWLHSLLMVLALYFTWNITSAKIRGIRTLNIDPSIIWTKVSSFKWIPATVFLLPGYSALSSSVGKWITGKTWFTLIYFKYTSWYVRGRGSQAVIVLNRLGRV